jgi:poly(3-hydroxybutyrate) depolymerase
MQTGGKLARLLAGTLHFFHLHKGTFHSGTFSHALVSRFYKLYVPRNYSGSAPTPLLVVLHVCSQDPDYFVEIGVRRFHRRRGHWKAGRLFP